MNNIQSNEEGMRRIEEIMEKLNLGVIEKIEIDENIKVKTNSITLNLPLEILSMTKKEFENQIFIPDFSNLFNACK